MTFRQRIEIGLARWVLGMMIGLVGLATYWVLDTESPARIIYSHPVPVAASSALAPNSASIQEARERGLINLPYARAGETIYTWREWCVTDSRLHAQGTLHRSLADTIVYNFPDTAPRLTQGQATKASPICYAKPIAVALPPGLPPGKYRYVVTAEYQKNPLRTVLIPWPDVEFEIVPGPPGADVAPRRAAARGR